MENEGKHHSLDVFSTRGRREDYNPSLLLVGEISRKKRKGMFGCNGRMIMIKAITMRIERNERKSYFLYLVRIFVNHGIHFTLTKLSLF